MVKNWMRPATCCFTGHRIIPAAVLPGLKEELEQAVREMVDRGVSRFLCGGARGFDTLAAQTVLQLKREYSTLELFLVLPCTVDYAVRQGLEMRPVGLSSEKEE